MHLGQAVSGADNTCILGWRGSAEGLLMHDGLLMRGLPLRA